MGQLGMIYLLVKGLEYLVTLQKDGDCQMAKITESILFAKGFELKAKSEFDTFNILTFTETNKLKDYLSKIDSKCITSEKAIDTHIMK